MSGNETKDDGFDVLPFFFILPPDNYPLPRIKYIKLKICNIEKKIGTLDLKQVKRSTNWSGSSCVTVDREITFKSVASKIAMNRTSCESIKCQTFLLHMDSSIII